MRVDYGGYWWCELDIDGYMMSLEGAGGGAGVGLGSAYRNYAVKSRNAAHDAHLGGYYSPGLSSGITNTSQYYSPTFISVVDSMAANPANPTTQIYRSVSEAEAQDIIKTGKFNLSPRGMVSKQFGFNLEETRQFGNRMGQNIIVSAKIPTGMLNNFYTRGVDTSIFRNGTLTVYGEHLYLFNQAISGTIKFLP